jgi:hypothetical protein
MLSAEYIASQSRAAAVWAAAQELEPYVPASTQEVLRWNRFTFPYFGDYRPFGWVLVETLFCDSSGLGYEDDPALTVDGLKRKVIDWLNRDATVGFAVLDAGEFQVYVGVFSQDETAIPEPGDISNPVTAEVPWYPCPECGEPIEDGVDECASCGWYKEDDEDIQEAYDLGEDAFMDGLGIDDNPYIVNTPDWIDWNEGFESRKTVFEKSLKSAGQQEFDLGENFQHK